MMCQLENFSALRWRCVVLDYSIRPLIAAGGPSPFVLTQKDQKVKSAERLLCHTSLCTANQAKPGLQQLPQSAHSRASANIAMPCRRTAPHRFP